MVLFSQALASALAEICNPALTDPYLIWSYVALVSSSYPSRCRSALTRAKAAAFFICAALFPTVFRHMNDSVDFGDVDRMEGKQQPLAIATESALVEDSDKKSVEV